MFENWGSPQESHRPLIQTPPYVLVMISHAYVSGESSLLLFFRFSLIQNDGAESDCAFLQFACRFYSCSLVACAFFQLFGCLVVNFFVRCTTICLQVEELATLWISLGRGLGDFDVPHPFHPWTYVSNQITHLFSDGIVSQEMPDVGVKLSARHLAPTRPFERNFGTSRSVEYC